jgi:hypothetical protein
MTRRMKRGLMEPDPHAPGISLVGSLWLVVFVMGVINVLLVLAN